MSAKPYSLLSKKTKLAEGPDDSLEPDIEPVDALVRSAPASAWPRADASKGPDGPADGPLGPGPTDAFERGLAPFDWARIEAKNRPLRELVPNLPDLDPDIALWPVTLVQRWPFAGAPSSGIWPKGWLGVDNTATLYVCTVAGQPGTWVALGGAGVLTSWGQASTAKLVGSGSPVGVVTPTGVGDLYVDDTTPQLWQANGLLNTNWEVVLSQWGLAITAKFKGAGSPVGVVTPNQKGDIYLDTSGPGVWQATGATSSSWEQLYVASDTGWLNLTLLNSWTTPTTARYRKVNGIVYVSFQVQNGSTPLFANLPAGFRPTDANAIWPVEVINSTTPGIGIASMNSSGNIFVENTNATTPTTGIGYISFVAEA